MRGRKAAGCLDAPVFNFAFHKTRSGRVFSEWDADAGEPLQLPPSVNLDSLFETSLSERMSLEEQGPLEDDPELEEPGTSYPAWDSPPPPWLSPPRIFQESLDAFPSPSTPPIPVSSSAASSTVAVPRGAVLDDGLTREQYHRKKQRAKHRGLRAEDRAKKQVEVSNALKAAAKRHRANVLPISTDFTMHPQNVHIAKTGVIGKAMKATAASRQHVPLKAARKLGFTYVKWSGRNSSVLVDANGRVFGSLSPGPNDARWPEIIRQAAETFAWAQKEMSQGDELEPPDHRRGPYWCGTDGFSMGSGQQRVGNFKLSRLHERILKVLKEDDNIKRIANFGSGCLRNYFPDVHKYYEETVDALLEADPSLRRNFVNNVFAAVTFNLGPQTCTRVHLDHLNLAFGLCAITALGKYDYTQGGHLILWDLKLIIEFPPGATILIPSAILRHSNVSIRRGETRYSLTQYSAGGIFRWVRCGFRTAKAHLAAGNDLRAEYEEWRGGYKMYSKLSDLRADV